ncbi:metal-dependent hydrolase (plasmid) [Natrinema zhouii]|uniref:metal-dependent hydrolase n=1 Tax=Natrinema zhouii TaxID=1710539 RepID=UPI001CFFA091|nr:metal-dependent hydrolase [Natrinema zhouii]UHQ99244.1 metal-dependent hydrolase [Natrinema zhouii]
MLFWVHAAVAYLLYRGALTVSTKKRPSGTTILALTIGTLLPDIIDKPLSFMFQSLPSRSLAHSLFTTVLVIGTVFYVLQQVNRTAVSVAYIFGYLSHLGADLVDSLFVPQETVVFLLWPLVTDYHHIGTVGELVGLVRPTPYVLTQMLVTGLAVVVWMSDGKPGYAPTQNQ